MRCHFCNKPVYGDHGITVIGHGPAHKDCLRTAQLSHRFFAGVKISALCDSTLQDLHETILMELNARKVQEQDQVELF